MPGYLVILFALGTGIFFPADYSYSKETVQLHGLFNGWFSFFIALGFHTPYWYFYLGLGLLAGALFDGN
jgi:hypothetical protein